MLQVRGVAGAPDRRSGSARRELRDAARLRDVPAVQLTGDREQRDLQFVEAIPDRRGGRLAGRAQQHREPFRIVREAAGALRLDQLW